MLTILPPRFLITAALLLTAAANLTAPCHADLPVLIVLHSFSSRQAGGAIPKTPLLQGHDGMLYGMTSEGGVYRNGIVFKVNADGTDFRVLHSFGASGSYSAHAVNSDGSSPEGSLVQDSSGTLYGAMGGGGAEGGGTIFKLNSDGSGFAILHNFKTFGELGASDGGTAPLGLALGSDGLLYGTTALGSENGEGVIYSITTSGTNYRVLYSFSSAIFGDNSNRDGTHPTSTLATANGSVFYGETLRGGKHGCGVIYKIMLGGKGFAVLHDFQRKAKQHKNSAADPDGTLNVGPDSFLYGNTQQEGSTDGGAVFKMNKDGSAFTILHEFSGTDADSADGSLPAGPLAFDTTGHLYGLTGEGGQGRTGILFRLNTEGAKFFVQHDFGAPDQNLSNLDGGFTLTGLTLGHNGNLYGVSTFGGANGTGTIFRVTFPAAK